MLKWRMFKLNLCWKAWGAMYSLPVVGHRIKRWRNDRFLKRLAAEREEMGLEDYVRSVMEEKRLERQFLPIDPLPSDIKESTDGR